MADHHPQYLPDRLLQAAITKGVSEKLGTFVRELSELTKGMTESDAKEAKRMLLGMMREAFGEFYGKMEARIERPEPPNVDNGRLMGRRQE